MLVHKYMFDSLYVMVKGAGVLCSSCVYLAVCLYFRFSLFHAVYLLAATVSGPCQHLV